MASVYKFPSEKFKIPYIIPSERTMISIKGTSDVLAACLGLKHIGPGVFSKTLQRCYLEYDEFPSKISDFFGCVDNFMKAQKWDPEYKSHIRAAFKRRISELFYRPDLEATLNLFNGNQNQLPEWFVKWLQGGVVLLDLTKCLEEEQHLIGMLILQMVDTVILLNREEADSLKYLVCLDEAHRLLGKSYDRDPESPEFILKNKSNSYFSISINEHGARGIGYIIADQNPSKLLESAIDSAKNKILFQLSFPNNQIFTENLKEREILLTLWERNALIMTDRERYLMETADKEEIEIIN